MLLLPIVKKNVYLLTGLYILYAHYFIVLDTQLFINGVFYGLILVKPTVDHLRPKL